MADPVASLALHVVSRAHVLQPPLAATFRATVRVHAEQGHRVHVVLLHDAVTRAGWVRRMGDVAAVHPRADDLRARALPGAVGALDDAGIVALCAQAAVVASW